MPDDRSLEALTAEDFRGYRGTRFRLTAGALNGAAQDSVKVELADVSEHAASPQGTFRAPFSVLFHGPLRPVLPQGIYRLEHEQFGAVELFIVPIGPDEPAEPGKAPTAMRYESVFG